MPDDVRLTPEQSAAIQEIDHNLQIIACAGSGKTEVISRRIAHILKSRSDVAPANVVAFTFTEKAAKSLKSRIAGALGREYEAALDDMYIGTIHGFCRSLLAAHTEAFADFKTLDSVKNHLFVDRYWAECGMADLGLEPYPRNEELFLQCIDKMIADYDNRDAWPQNQQNALQHYIDCLYTHKYLDYSLQIFEALRQMRESPKAKEYLSTIKYLVVDEYQDVDDVQERLIQCMVQAGANICVVGDDDQTIYQFRGSNANNMITFAERYPDVRQIRLELNFRCAPEIVDIADTVIEHNTNRLSKTMLSAQPLGAITEASGYQSPEDEFEAIAEQICTLQQSGINYRDIAILVRKRKYIGAIAETLSRHSIPVETDTAEHIFTSAYFSRLLGTLQQLNDLQKSQLYEYWQDEADADLDAFNAAFRFLRSSSRSGHVSLCEIVAGFVSRFNLAPAGSAGDWEAEYNAFMTVLSDYDEIYGDWQLSARINGVLRFFGYRAPDEYKYHNFETSEEVDEPDAVQIMTIHKAKGLEFEAVFLPRLMQREFPSSNHGGRQFWHILGGSFEDQKYLYQSDEDDERKLFYVAVTRAKRKLFLSYDLSALAISKFVKEASESMYLDIDPEDLVSTEDVQDRKALARYAKKQLVDYYGTAGHFCPGAFGDLSQLSSMTDEEIISEAKRNLLL